MGAMRQAQAVAAVKGGAVVVAVVRTELPGLGQWGIGALTPFQMGGFSVQR
jgi:hypothetical protein